MRGGDPTEAAIGLGANLGDRLGALRAAVAALDVHPEVTVTVVSAVYETEALVRPGAAPQPDHLNAAALVRTTLAPRALLAVLHGIERDAGRDFSAPRWSPRPLDLDLLYVGDRRISEPGLVVPHPALALRRFVLAPLAEIAPDRAVPGLGQTVAEVLAACPDPLAVRRTSFLLRD